MTEQTHDITRQEDTAQEERPLTEGEITLALMDLQDIAKLAESTDIHHDSLDINRVAYSLLLLVEGFIEPPETQQLAQAALERINTTQVRLYEAAKAARQQMATAVEVAQTLKEQRDAVTDDHTGLLNALRRGDTDHPEIASFMELIEDRIYDWMREQGWEG